jgi:hypothetical protein
LKSFSINNFVVKQQTIPLILLDDDGNILSERFEEVKVGYWLGGIYGVGKLLIIPSTSSYSLGKCLITIVLN